MAFTDIAERRQLRRKLTFWRVAAMLLVTVAIIALGTLLFGTDESKKAQPHIARVVVSGLIVDDTELVERLDEIAESLKRSSLASKRRRGTPYQSAMSMLNFYINRAGRHLPKTRRNVLQAAKGKLREAFGRPR